MVLKIKPERRVQTDRKGRPQSVAFILDIRLQVDENERHVIEEFRLGRHLVHRAEALIVTTEDLLTGWNREFSALHVALAVERSIIEGCRELVALMDAARGFDGERTVNLSG